MIDRPQFVLCSFEPRGVWSGTQYAYPCCMPERHRNGIADPLGQLLLRTGRTEGCYHRWTHVLKKSQRIEARDKTHDASVGSNGVQQQHADHALELGGEEFPTAIREVMTVVSKVMTKTTYHL